MLLDVARLRQLDWVYMWKSVATRELAALQFTVLADQVTFHCSPEFCCVNIALKSSNSQRTRNRSGM